MEKKNCFIIMPISDSDGYDKGHFSRVYEHLIKPSVINSGFNPVRADDKKNTNYIVIDILQMILEAEIVICDLSNKNANVLYELGIRQAFNKKVLLIKDKKTDRIFDIQGLRYIEYDETLRIDSVKKDIELISEALLDTHKASENEINSLIQLLSIKPATISKSVEISNETTLVLKAIQSIDDRLNKLEQKSPMQTYELKGEDSEYIINNEKVKIGTRLFRNSVEIGALADVHSDAIFIRDLKGKILKYSTNSPGFNEISIYPF